MPIIFFIFWIILNGNVTLEIVLFGIVISCAVYFFCQKFLRYNIKKEIKLYRKVFRYIGYAALVIWEIAKANVDVLKVIYDFKHKPDSILISFQSDLKKEAARTALANSITLTPGTITVFQEDEMYTVHCLDKSFANGIEESSFVHSLRKIEAMDGECTGRDGKEVNP